MFDVEKLKNNSILQKISAHYMDLDIHNSTALEGNELTRAEVSVFIDNGITIHGKKFVDYMEVNNYNNALRWLKDNVHNHSLELSNMLVKKIHQILTNGILYSEENKNFSGKFRNDYVFLSTTTYVPPYHTEIEDRLQDSICKYYKNIESGYTVFEAACVFHREFERIHPFFDGNGRTGRVLFNMLIIQAGYPYLTIDVSQRADYFEALEEDTFFDFATEVMEQNYADFLRKEAQT